MIFPKRAAQSLSEYGTVFGLVVVITVAVVFVMGNQGSDLIENSNRQLFEKGNDGNSKAEKLVSSLSSDTSRTVRVTLDDGQTLTLSRYPANLSESVQVTGTGGTTDRLSLTIEEIARQLRDQGEIDEAQYNQMRELANQGHLMASYMRKMEEVAGNGLTQAEFAKATFAINGQTFSVNDASCLLGSHGRQSSCPADFLRPRIPVSAFTDSLFAEERNRGEKEVPYQGALVQDLFLKFEKILTIPAVEKDKTLSLVLGGLFRDIANLGQSSASAKDDIGFNANSKLFMSKQFEYFAGLAEPEDAASDKAHGNSAGICNLGSQSPDGKDSGVYCPES